MITDTSAALRKVNYVYTSGLLEDPTASCYWVVAELDNCQRMVHKKWFTTSAKAAALEQAVRARGFISPEHWLDATYPEHRETPVA